MSRKGILVFIFFIVATMLVPACGGGGSSSSSNDSPPLPPPPDAPIALSATTFSSGEVIYAAEGGNQTGGNWNLYSIDPATGRIDLSWTDNSDNETGFKIERKTDAGTYSQIATVGAGVTAFSDSGLSASTEYYYRVRASNSGGNSGYSNEDNATTTLVATVIGPIGFGVTGMDFGPGGVLYGTTSDGGANPFSLITINTATGAGTFVAQTDDASTVNHPFPTFTFVGAIPYGITACVELRSFNITSGLVSGVLGIVPICFQGGGIAADNGSANVYHTLGLGQPLFTINMSTYAFTFGPALNGGVPAVPQILDATFHQGTLFVMGGDGWAGNRQLMTVNTTSGLMTPVGSPLTSNWISAIVSREGR